MLYLLNLAGILITNKNLENFKDCSILGIKCLKILLEDERIFVSELDLLKLICIYFFATSTGMKKKEL